MAATVDSRAPGDLPDLQFTTRYVGTTTIVELTGEWDLTATPATRRVLVTALDQKPECVVLDLTALSFIDSSGLHGTVELAERARHDGVRLAIIVGARQVRRLFEISGLIDRLPIIDGTT